MIVKNVAMQAYKNALDAQSSIENKVNSTLKAKEPEVSFSDTLKGSLTKVNQMQSEKVNMIEAFATGESQNVHELMITLQKAGLAMNMTGAVRTKIMSAYQEIMRMQF